MPFYDLKCTKCNNEFNIRASMEERENGRIKCPDCGDSRLETIFKSIGILKTKEKRTFACPNIEKCGSCPYSG